MVLCVLMTTADANHVCAPPLYACLTEDLFKICLIVTKFRDAGGRVQEGGCTARVTRWLSLDMRTKRGQHAYLRGCLAFALLCTIPLFTSGDKLCFRL